MVLHKEQQLTNDSNTRVCEKVLVGVFQNVQGGELEGVLERAS